MSDKKESGFEDDQRQMPCVSSQHNPPSHLVIPTGKIYRHVCPSCGREVILRPPFIGF